MKNKFNANDFVLRVGDSFSHIEQNTEYLVECVTVIGDMEYLKLHGVCGYYEAAHFEHVAESSSEAPEEELEVTLPDDMPEELKDALNALKGVIGALINNDSEESEELCNHPECLQNNLKNFIERLSHVDVMDAEIMCSAAEALTMLADKSAEIANTNTPVGNKVVLDIEGLKAFISTGITEHINELNSELTPEIIAKFVTQGIDTYLDM